MWFIKIGLRRLKDNSLTTLTFQLYEFEIKYDQLKPFEANSWILLTLHKSLHISYISKIPTSDSLFKFKRVTPNDTVCHVAKLKTSKSGKIPTRFLKDGVKSIAHLLSSLFNKSMKSGVFPDNLKRASICPIYKGEGSKFSPNNYRLISVRPIVAQLFEKNHSQSIA